MYITKGVLILTLLSVKGKTTNNLSTELEMTSDARQNGGKDRYLKHCKWA